MDWMSFSERAATSLLRSGWRGAAGEVERERWGEFAEDLRGSRRVEREKSGGLLLLLVVVVVVEEDERVFHSLLTGEDSLMPEDGDAEEGAEAEAEAEAAEEADG